MQQLNNSTISAAAVTDLLLDVVPSAMAAMRVELRRNRPVDLNMAQMRALGYVYRHPQVSLSAVAEHLDLTLSSVSKLADDLVTRGYLRRETCSDDRRRAELRLTPRGRQVVTVALRQVGSTVRERLAQVDPAATAEIAAGLRHLRLVFPSPADLPNAAGSPPTAESDEDHVRHTA